MIGLLQCDHVHPDFRHIAGDYDDMFRRWLPADWRVYDAPAGELPRTPDECAGYVTTGSRASVYDPDPWIGKLAAFVRDLHRASVPMFGVCFGHQMIAHALGGQVTRCRRGWGIGVHTFHVTSREPWMDPPLDSFGVLMSCQDQVEQLPADAVVLGGSDFCPVGLFRCGTLAGIQGHPEFPADYARALMEFRRDRIGPALVDAALATLGKPLHSAEIAGWVDRFLSGVVPSKSI